MSEFELIINDVNTVHGTTEEAKQAAYVEQVHRWGQEQDRKSTRLNSSH